MVYDITDRADHRLCPITSTTREDFAGNPNQPAAVANLGPEGLYFVGSRRFTPNGEAHV